MTVDFDEFRISSFFEKISFYKVKLKRQRINRYRKQILTYGSYSFLKNIKKQLRS